MIEVRFLVVVIRKIQVLSLKFITIKMFSKKRLGGQYSLRLDAISLGANNVSPRQFTSSSKPSIKSSKPNAKPEGQYST